MPNVQVARDAGDDLQRGQAFWALFPQSWQRCIISVILLGATTVGSVLIGIWKSYDGWQLYVGSVALGCCVVMSYAIARSLLKSGTAPAPRTVDRPLLVRAVGRGSYKSVPRHLWSEFTLDDPTHFSDAWMARVDVDTSDDAPNGPLPVRVRAAQATRDHEIELYVTSDSHTAIRSVRLVILNILTWNEQTGSYVETPDVHEHGSFIPRILATHDLFPGVDVRYGEIMGDDHNVVICRDRRESMCCLCNSTGLRRIEYRIVDDENRELRGAICVRAYTYHQPTVVDCPNTA